MAIPSYLRNPYRSSVPPVVEPWINPDRISLMNYRHLWQYIRQFVVAAMIGVALYSPAHSPQSLWMIAMVMLLYVLWQLGFQFLLHTAEAADPRRQRRLGILQFVFSTAGVTVLVWLMPPLAATDAWLLYLIPLLTVGRTLERRWAFVFIFSGVGLAALSAFAPYAHALAGVAPPATAAADQDLWAAVRNFFLRGFASGYVGFSSYLVIRSLAFQNRMITAATERMNEVTMLDSWHKAANRIAELIAETLSDGKRPVTANVIAYNRSDDTLTIVGSSSERGQNEIGYQYTADKGVTGWAARHEAHCYLNDTANDPDHRFLPHEAFPATRSALAVPFPVDDQETVVLDVESSRTDGFASEDLQLLQIVGSHLRASHERTRIIELHRALASLGQELAGSIIRVDQISAMLQAIGQRFKGLLGADAIIFYYRHSDASAHYMRTPVGAFLTDRGGAMELCEPDKLLVELMDRQEPAFFPAARAEPKLTTERPHHYRHKVKPFVVRESIVSCAAIPLVVAQESIGLMWINYRRPQAFRPYLRNLIQLLTPYAALAIQAGRQNLAKEERERDKLRRMVHDSLAHRLHDVARALDALRRRHAASPNAKDELRIATAQVTRAQQAVNNLIHQRTEQLLQSLVEDLRHQAQLIGDLYKIPVNFTAGDLPRTEISLVGGNELLYACDEVIGNALRHAQLTRLAITVGCRGDILEVQICDDGIGFDYRRITPGLGLYSIQQRIEVLNGTTTIESQPHCGTRVTFCVPLRAQEEAQGGDHAR